MERSEIKIHKAKRSKTSYAHESRFIPIIPAMLELLKRLQAEKRPEPADRVCVLGECEKSLTRACRIVGCARITHHDLRHLFATRCIEAGVDIPTVSRWLWPLSQRVRINGRFSERVLEMASCRCQAPDHDANHANPNHRLAGVQVNLIISAPLPRLEPPAESAFPPQRLGNPLKPWTSSQRRTISSLN